MLTVQRLITVKVKRSGSILFKALNEVMDNEVNAINDREFAPKTGTSNKHEFTEMGNQSDTNIQENKPDTYKTVADAKNNDQVEELIIRNSKLEIVGASSRPNLDSDSLLFSEFLEKRQEDLNNNNDNENEATDSMSNSLSSPGGIRTKILTKGGFSEYFVKNTLKGKGVILRGPPQDKAGVNIQTQTNSATTTVSSNNDSVCLREWLNWRGNKINKSKSLYIFKQILNFVDLSHSRGVVLQALKPSCFRLLPSNEISYVDKELMESEGEKEIVQLSKRQKQSQNRNNFARWPQFPNSSGNSRDVKPYISGDLLEEQWYASPEEVKERLSTFSSNIYSLGVFLFELLGSFESSREHAVAMMNLRQRILPPSFLSENPKEAGYCLWLLHPEGSARPTTRDILKSKLVSEIEEMSTDDLLSSIAQEDADSELLLHFLASLKDQKQKYATNLIQTINSLESDIAEVELRRQNNSSTLSNNLIQENKLSPFSNHDKLRLKSNLTQLETAYFSMRSSIELSDNNTTNSTDQKVINNQENQKPLDRVGIFFNGLCKYARYSRFEVRGNLRSGDFSSSANVICSLGFDRDEDYFATAGVSKKIKVYDFHMLLDDSVDIHYPAIEMANKSKLTYISWNKYIKNYLASTDYDGIVKLWDVGSGQAISHHIEHERRAWSVDFSGVDPTKLASGGDDCYVKLWSINEKKSISTIKNIANVCCVQFSPYSSHLLSFGSSDYRTYCYDLRNISSPLCILAGHDRAVSYVRFLDSETLVSASTDNTLKLWDLNKTNFGCLSTNGCVLTFRGHTNEKNFVGLSVADGYIACGSETNEVFAYYKSLPMPITSHKFGSIDPVSGKETDHRNNQFVSSVCWRQKSDMVVAANSSGCLKLLQMV